MKPPDNNKGFSLVEVVLAIGVLSLAIVSLLGLFGPIMSSVKNVVDHNLAATTVSKINTYIQRENTWDEALAFVQPDSIHYVWQEDDGSGNVELRISQSLSDLPSDLNNLIGPPMLVTMERGLPGNYDFGNVADEGYFPILIKIYSVDASNFGSYTSITELESLQPIFSYTTAKNRSF